MIKCYHFSQSTRKIWILLCHFYLGSILPKAGEQRGVLLLSLSCECAWWGHQMGTCSDLLAFCAWNSPVTGEFPAQGQWRETLMFSLICTWTNGWMNNRHTGDLRRHGALYDVTVMERLFLNKIMLDNNILGEPCVSCYDTQYVDLAL